MACAFSATRDPSVPFRLRPRDRRGNRADRRFLPVRFRHLREIQKNQQIIQVDVYKTLWLRNNTTIRYRVDDPVGIRPLRRGGVKMGRTGPEKTRNGVSPVMAGSAKVVCGRTVSPVRYERLRDFLRTALSGRVQRIVLRQRQEVWKKRMSPKCSKDQPSGKDLIYF